MCGFVLLYHLDLSKRNCVNMTEILQSSMEGLKVHGSAGVSQNAGKDDLILELDKLLERYLNTLDEYEKIGKELSKQLSSVRSLFYTEQCNCMLIITGLHVARPSQFPQLLICNQIWPGLL